MSLRRFMLMSLLLITAAFSSPIFPNLPTTRAQTPAGGKLLILGPFGSLNTSDGDTPLSLDTISLDGQTRQPLTAAVNAEPLAVYTALGSKLAMGFSPSVWAMSAQRTHLALGYLAGVPVRTFVVQIVDLQTGVARLAVQQRLNAEGDRVSSLRVAPDGSSVIYAVKAENETAQKIMWAATDGSEPREILGSPFDVLAWSPDGNLLAYIQKSGIDSEIVASDLSDIKGTAKVLGKTSERTFHLTWASAGNAVLLANAKVTIIYPLAGERVTQRNFKSPPSFGVAGSVTGYGNLSGESAAWSPDDSLIAYTAADAQTSLQQVFAVPSAGGEAVMLSAATGEQTPYNLQWVLDGSAIAFTSLDAAAVPSLAIVPTNGTANPITVIAENAVLLGVIP